jgi:hypothetical protein
MLSHSKCWTSVQKILGRIWVRGSAITLSSEKHIYDPPAFPKPSDGCSYSPTRMFALANPMSQVSSTAFAQGRLTFGSSLLRPAHPFKRLLEIISF